jgi:ferredoxin
MATITTVWIESGCIGCYACEQAAPEVFALTDAVAHLLAVVRVDQQSSTNEQERSPLNAVGLEYEEAIREAAAGCPMEIIRFDSQ